MVKANEKASLGEDFFLSDDLPTTTTLPNQSKRAWRILVVDDDRSVHAATLYALHAIRVAGKPIETLSAYSAAEALQVLAKEENIAVIVTDVVMETPTAGLDLVKKIRDDLRLSEVRIILRTGQPGLAPELDVISEYDINDYRLKSEITRSSLHTAVATAIRAYDQIHTINYSKRGLDMILNASSELMTRRGLTEFATGVITQLCAILGIPTEGLVCVQARIGGPPIVVAAAGKYSGLIAHPVYDIGDKEVIGAINAVFASRKHFFDDTHSVLYFSRDTNKHMAVYLDMAERPTDIVSQLIDVFCSNVASCFDNVLLFNKLHESAYIDPQLSIPNRLAFSEAINKAIADTENRYTVILLDIDNFSELNDAMGFSFGDQLLMAAAMRLNQFVSVDIMIARIGGDVFGVLAKNNIPTAEQLHELFQTPLTLTDGDEQLISMSIGMEHIGDHLTSDEVLKSANIALNYAKLEHPGRTYEFTPGMEQATKDRVQLMHNLRQAFSSENMYVEYQPQISLSTGEPIGVEALIRWKTESGYIPPDQFIPLAESSGLIFALGEMVLRRACTEQTTLRYKGRPMRIAVNVSVVQFQHPKFLDMVDAVLADTGADPTLLELEITESVAMSDPKFVIDIITQLKKRQITVALDDFGTGFSSLAYLEQLPIDRLKIDRSFIAQMSESKSGRRIAETVIKLGQALDLVVIAEGVETEQQVAQLRKMGCHECQGYLYAKPMPPQQLHDWLLQYNK